MPAADRAGRPRAHVDRDTRLIPSSHVEQPPDRARRDSPRASHSAEPRQGRHSRSPALEGVLVLAGAIPWWLVVVLALGALGTYAGWGREHESPDVRVVTWTAAVSQLVVVLVPVLAGALVVLAAAAVVACAALALVALLLDRR